MKMMEEKFENDVKTYSIQTHQNYIDKDCQFENDVKTYSIQTIEELNNASIGLRMM